MNNINININSCDCDICKSSCRNRPGFFLPDEVEPAGKKLGLNLKEFFDKYLVVDYYFGDKYADSSTIIPFNNEPCVYLLAPGRKIGGNLGDMAPYHPKGVCIFFNSEGLCDIHSDENLNLIKDKLVKPQECRLAHHSLDFNERKMKEYELKRIGIIQAWNNQQCYDMICELLGRKPAPLQPTMQDRLQFIKDKFNL